MLFGVVGLGLTALRRKALNDEGTFVPHIKVRYEKYPHTHRCRARRGRLCQLLCQRRRR